MHLDFAATSDAFRKTLQFLWREWLRPLALLLIIFAPLRSAIVDWNWVPTGSMKPTILEGDLVLVNKLAYDLKVPFTTTHLIEWNDPARGEIVVCYSPADGTRLVKRVIGLPGDTVELRQGIVYLNGTPASQTPASAEKIMREVFEDPTPTLSREVLADSSHWVLSLPGKLAIRDFGPYVVPENAYFLMGDSRDNSHDSRFFGPVARDQILGRASAVIVSFDKRRFFFPRFDRLGTALE